MWRNYLKIAYRNIIKNKVYSFINISGLAIGMAVAMLIGLWIYEEMIYNHNHQNYPRIAQVLQNQTVNEETYTLAAMPRPLEMTLRDQYANDIEYLSMTSWDDDHILNYKGHMITRTGNFFQADFPKILTLDMAYGSIDGLKDPKSILLSEATAQALFGFEDPTGKLVKLDNQASLKVSGVYKDLPKNSYFLDLGFMASWEWYLTTEEWAREAIDQWDDNSFQVFVQLKPHASMARVSQKIKDVKLQADTSLTRYNPQIFLFPMDDWNLYGEFKNGENIGGKITYIWLFGCIGAFVLLLACINFTNLSTARSEKKAKEVGVRKVIGSLKSQLIGQFLSESCLTSFFAFLLSLLLVEFMLPNFNLIADKDISIPWSSPGFYLVSLGFTSFTGILAGLYPAFYLSSFRPVAVLKGSYRTGKRASLPRKVLVEVQFTVSVTLIIGTMTIYRQIQFVKNRPVGYEREGLIMIRQNSPVYKGKIDILRRELTQAEAITHIGQSSSPLTAIWSNRNGFEWKGKGPNMEGDFAAIWVGNEFGNTVNWTITQGRDFSKDFASDSAAIILNEAAVKFMKIQDPVGMEILDDRKNRYHVIGVIKDMIQQNPASPVRQTLYFQAGSYQSWYTLRLHPEKSFRESLAKVKTVFAEVLPQVPFEYTFVDERYARKFQDEERIGTLAGVFTILAILISCLGLFGLASYMAEKRMKEIGIRKVLGASVSQLWQLLSYDFLILVLISSALSVPIAYYYLNTWLGSYEIHTELSWWVFALSTGGAVLITLLTVSYQALKAATLNPVEVLKDE